MVRKVKKKEEKKEVPLIYIYVYAKFKKHLKGTPFVRPSYLLEILKRACRIPKVLHYPILFEMANLKLIRRVNQQLWEVLGSNCDKKLRKYKFKSDRLPWD